MPSEENGAPIMALRLPATLAPQGATHLPQWEQFGLRSPIPQGQSLENTGTKTIESEARKERLNPQLIFFDAISDSESGIAELTP
jgi:hypothetical protein